MARALNFSPTDGASYPYSPLNYLDGLIDGVLKDRIKEAFGAETTQAEIARRMSVSKATVTLWFDGTTSNMTAENAAKIEALTGYRWAYIVTGNGPKRVQDVAHGWPFDEAKYKDWEALSERQKGVVDAKLAAAIRDATTPISGSGSGKLQASASSASLPQLAA